MPIFTYRFDDGTERDEFFASWRDATPEIEVDGQRAVKVPARFASHFENKFLKAKAKDGYVPWERGMENDAKRARKHIEQKQEAVRHEVIAKTLAQF